MAYFLLSYNEDGLIINVVDPKLLTNELNDEHYGENPIFLKDLSKDVLSKINSGMGLDNDDRTTHILISGKIVVPEPINKVTEYRIPQ